MTNLKAIQLNLLYNYRGALPFDVYIERAPGKFSKLYHRNTDFICDQLMRLKDKKVTKLYIDYGDISEFSIFLATIVDEFFVAKLSLTADELNELLTCCIDIVFDSFTREEEIFQENKNWVLPQAKRCISIITKNISSAMGILKTINQNVFLLQHSIQVMIFSLILAKLMKLETEKTLSVVGLGALLHDIGQSRIDQELLKKIHLTSTEWDCIRDHPHHGIKMLDHIADIPHEIRHIIVQHHEQYNGRGYPNRLSGKAIYPLAHLVSIADGFCSFLFKTPYREISYGPHQCIELMKSDLGHYDPQILEILENHFAKSKDRHSA